MNVLHVGKFYPPRWGGMETAVKDICESIAGSVKVRVLVANDSWRRVSESVAGVAVTRLGRWGTAFSQPITPSLVGEMRRARADIVHLHEPNPLAMLSFLASGCEGRLVIHYHSDIVRQRRLEKLYAPLRERAFARASAVVVGSRELLESSWVLRGWKEKCVVVPFGIDLDPFLAIRRARPDRTHLPLVLAVGRLSYYKGFHYLIEAMRSTPARLVIAGEGELRGALECLIRRWDLGSRVQLAGRVSEAGLHAWYQQADIFCLSSCERSEAFGLVQVEAMAAGLPLVSTDLPTGVRAINVHGETGLVAPAHDTEALAASLGQLAADPATRQRMGSAGRDRARRLFSRDRMGRRILEIYNAVHRGKLECFDGCRS